MTAIHTLQTALELVIVSALIWGLFNERKIVLWERKLFRKIKRKYGKCMRRFS